MNIEKKFSAPRRIRNLSSIRYASPSLSEEELETDTPLEIDAIEITAPSNSKQKKTSIPDNFNDDDVIDNSMDEDEQQVSDKDKMLFEACSRLVQEQRTWLGRTLSWLYAERKLVFCFFVHLLATLVIWQHFFQRKYYQKFATIPENVNRYWWKVLTPSFEFGVMHVVLFQMALLPLTMARFSLAYLSTTPLNKVIPFERMVDIHIYLGYLMVFLVIISTFVFFAFFGLLCEEQKTGLEPLDINGERSFCNNFTMEIMNTGYGIVGSLLIIGGTAYLRNVIPYEVFYLVHHVVFAMYAITIAHTFDQQFRRGLIRSQTFKWFCGPLLLYLTDRFFMWSKMFNAKVEDCIAIGDDDIKRYSSSDMIDAANESVTHKHRGILLTLKKPVHFGYQPGHYIFLRCLALDTTWHPFSIASDPNDKMLQFYIEVYSPGSWTDKLHNLAINDPKLRTVTFDIIGPYGTSFNSSQADHLCMIGAGTGIVPMLSLLRQISHQYQQLNPKIFHSLGEKKQDHMKMIIASDKSVSRTVHSIAKVTGRTPPTAGYSSSGILTTLPGLRSAQDGYNPIVEEKRVASISASLRAISAKMANEQNQRCFSSFENEQHSIHVDDSVSSPTCKLENVDQVSDNKPLRVSINSEDFTNSDAENSINSPTEESDLPRASSGALNRRELLSRMKTGSFARNLPIERVMRRVNKLHGMVVLHLITLLLPLLEVLLTGLALSWNYTEGFFPITDELKIFVDACSFTAVISFSLVTLCTFKVNSFFDWIDIIIIAISCFTLARWRDEYGSLTQWQVLGYISLSMYRAYRDYEHTNRLLHVGNVREKVETTGITALMRLQSVKIVWINRDAARIKYLWPQLDQIYSDLVQSWGKSRARKVLRFEVYVTDKNTEAVEQLHHYCKDTMLYKDGIRHNSPVLINGRPENVADIVIDQLTNRIKQDIAVNNGVPSSSHTLIAFCGKRLLGNVVAQAVMEAEILAYATKHRLHTLQLIQQNYGVTHSKKKPNSINVKGASIVEEGDEGIQRPDCKTGGFEQV